MPAWAWHWQVVPSSAANNLATRGDRYRYSPGTVTGSTRARGRVSVPIPTLPGLRPYARADAAAPGPRRVVHGEEVCRTVLCRGLAFFLEGALRPPRHSRTRRGTVLHAKFHYPAFDTRRERVSLSRCAPCTSADTDGTRGEPRRCAEQTHYTEKADFFFPKHFWKFFLTRSFLFLS